jgi:hypothetical protein
MAAAERKLVAAVPVASLSGMQERCLVSCIADLNNIKAWRESVVQTKAAADEAEPRARAHLLEVLAELGRQETPDTHEFAIEAGALKVYEKPAQ